MSSVKLKQPSIRVHLCHFSALTILATLLSIAPLAAADSDPNEDFCIADLLSPIHVDGYVCKTRAEVTNEDFVYRGLRTPSRSPSKSFSGSTSNVATAREFPGLNAQSLSTGRIDYEINGINLPHWHPRASEILTLVKGELYVAFVDSKYNRLWYSTLHQGDIYIFPRGLVHFQMNTGKTTAMATISLNSQSPGRQDIGMSVFGSGIGDDVLQKSFDLSESEVKRLKHFFETHHSEGDIELFKASVDPDQFSAFLD